MRYYKPKYFTAQELVPPDYFKLHGDDSISAIDTRILITLDSLREKLGRSITINNWATGGQFSQRGLRTDLNVGAPKSAHRIGCAVDFDIKELSADVFRKMVRAGQLEKELAMITRIEDVTSWVHIDVMPIDGKQIVFFKP